MEESLTTSNFDPKKWLTSNLEFSSPESLDVQLSELNFNLVLYKNQLEESVLNSQSLIQSKTKDETIDQTLWNISKEYASLQEYLNVQANNQTNPSEIKVNETLFNEINEISLVKTRLHDTLQMMDLIMSLEFHLDEILVFLEEKNLKDLQEKIESLSELFKLITKLPFHDSRREKQEIIIVKIKEFLIQILSEKFGESERMPFELCMVYKILRNISMENLFFEYYHRVRFDRVLENFIETCNSCINENMDFLELFCETIKKEIDYFADLFTNKLSELMSQIIRESSCKLISYLIDKFYYKSFNNNEYQDKILVFLTSYLKICKFLNNQIENGVILNRIDISEIEICCFSIFSSISNNILTAEFTHNSKLILKTIRKDFEKNQETETFEEKILRFTLLKLPEIIEISFQRVHELLFGMELDGWILDFQKITEEIFQKFNRLLDELEFKNFPHAILDNIIVFTKGTIKKEDIQLVETTERKFLVSENFSLIELLLDKYEELNYLEDTMGKLDKEIRVKIMEINTENFPDLFGKIQNFLIENNKNGANRRKKLVFSLKTGLILFEGLFNGINNCKKKIKKILLKIFLSDSLEKMQEMMKLPLWKEVENKQQIMTFQKITEQVSAICQNFFLHMQIFEEIKQELLKNSIVSNYLDSLDLLNKNEILIELYQDKLRYELYMFENENESSCEIRNKSDMVKFWGSIYAHFLIKIFCFCLKNINEISIGGRKQLKIDIEYIMNVLNEYLSESSKNILEELMSFLQHNENKKNVYLRGVSHSDLGFI